MLVVWIFWGQSCKNIFRDYFKLKANTYSCTFIFSPEACGSKSVYDGPEEEEYSTFIIDDPKETYKTLKLIIEGVGTLEQEHAQYKRDKFKKTKYGSQ